MFIIALVYLVSPFISLGVFLHILQDSFTTSKDRGCEWFYPLSRLVKRGRYDVNGHPQPLDPSHNIYFYQEDPHGLVEHADLDLREEGPCPWRRVYGPALKSHLLDRGFLLGSIIVMMVWLVEPDGAHLQLVQTYPITDFFPYVVAYVSLIVLFLAGELDRRDKPLRIPRFNFVKYPIFGVGLILFITWLALYRTEILVNLKNIASHLIPILFGVGLIIILSFALVKWHTRAGRTTMV